MDFAGDNGVVRHLWDRRLSGAEAELCSLKDTSIFNIRRKTP
jgi:hypothetical protein